MAQAGAVVNWYAEAHFAVTIAGGSIGGLCAGVALRGIGAMFTSTSALQVPWKRGVPGLLSRAIS